jgi:hypothetical protein
VIIIQSLTVILEKLFKTHLGKNPAFTHVDLKSVKRY